VSHDAPHTPWQQAPAAHGVPDGSIPSVQVCVDLSHIATWQLDEGEGQSLARMHTTPPPLLDEELPGAPPIPPPLDALDDDEAWPALVDDELDGDEPPLPLPPPPDADPLALDELDAPATVRSDSDTAEHPVSDRSAAMAKLASAMSQVHSLRGSKSF
jgi:hypothetical protein